MPDSATRSWVEIDRAALRHNLQVAKDLAGGAEIMAVVKADAYGHGMLETARILEDGTAIFGVATVEEGLELRAGGIRTPVFLLGPLLPAERAVAAEAGFVSIISGVEEARAMAALGAEVHLAVDTGMGRAGIWKEEIFSLIQEIISMNGLRVTGIATHLPVADEDREFTSVQLQEYAALAREIRSLLPGIKVSHALNSAGLMRFPEHAPDLVRVGLMLYGVSPLPEFQSRLEPVLTWKTRVTLVRNLDAGRGVSYGRTHITGRATRVATLGVGYADGYARILSGNGACVLIAGKRCPVLGRITMDQIMVDVGGVEDVESGTVAVLLGRQGTEEISASEMANKAGTIAWEILTGIQQRVKREFTCPSEST